MNDKFDLLPYRDSLAGTLLAAREAVMAPLRPFLRDAGLTEQQWRILRILVDRGSVDQSQLAHGALLHAPSVTRIIRDMAAKGLVERSDDPDDKRRAILHISPAGRALFDDIAAQAADIMTNYADHFGNKRLAMLRRELTELTHVLSRLVSQEDDGLETSTEEDR